MTSAVARPVHEDPEAPRPDARDGAGRSPVPGQRTSHRLIVAPPVATGWEGYSNAGPDVYWSPDRGEVLTS